MMTKAERRALTAENGGVAPVEKHNRSTYVNWGCRCKPCRAGNSRHRTAQRAIKLRMTRDNGGIAPTEIHNATTYESWGCSCPTCKKAKSAKNAKRDRSRRASGRKSTFRGSGGIGAESPGSGRSGAGGI